MEKVGEDLEDSEKNISCDDDKGLFINDVIIFGGYRDPPPLPLVITRHFLATPPPKCA